MSYAKIFLIELPLLIGEKKTKTKCFLSAILKKIKKKGGDFKKLELLKDNFPA